MGWTIFGGGGAGGFNFAMNSAIDPGGVTGNPPLPPSHSQTNIAFTSGGETLSPFLDTVSGTVTTAFFTVAVGVPVPISIDLRVDGVATLGATGTAQFLNSMDFPLTNIFNFDTPGFTVNDPDMFIVNNNFVPPSGAVPEPSTWTMMLLGFAGLGFAFRPSRRKVSFA
jgi:hypothetical protein